MVKNEKKTGYIWFILIIIIFIVFGYYIYKSYTSKVEDNNESVKINDFYNIDYLFNNGYLTSAKTIQNLDKSIDMSLDSENNLNINAEYSSKKYSKTISGLDTKKYTIYYDRLSDTEYELIAQSDDGNSVYYTSFNIVNSNDSTTFEKIEEKIKSVYVPSYDKSNVYININNDFHTNFVLVDSKKQLKYIDYKDNKYTFESNFKEKKPYFDYVCADDLSLLCNDLIIYKSFNDELVYNNEKLKLDDKVIYVRDMFSSFEIKSNDEIDFSLINKSNLNKYDYLFTTYIVDEQGLLYKLDITKEGQNIECINKNSDKVKELDYDESKISIVFINGEKETVTKDKNKILVTSTMYDKKNNRVFS